MRPQRTPGRLQHWAAAAWGAFAYLIGLPPSLRLLGGRGIFSPLTARWRDRR